MSYIVISNVSELDEEKICRKPCIWWETLVSSWISFWPIHWFSQVLAFLFAVSLLVGLAALRAEYSNVLPCLHWMQLASGFSMFFFPLHQRQGLKSLKSTWFTVRGCIPTLKCFRIISHLLSCCLGFVWRKPTRWAALSLIFLSTIRFATVHGLALMKPRNKSTGDRYIRWTVT